MYRGISSLRKVISLPGPLTYATVTESRRTERANIDAIVQDDMTCNDTILVWLRIRRNHPDHIYIGHARSQNGIKKKSMTVQMMSTFDKIVYKTVRGVRARTEYTLPSSSCGGRRPQKQNDHVSASPLPPSSLQQCRNPHACRAATRR